MDDLTSTFVSIDFLVERYEENLALDSYVVRKKEKYFKSLFQVAEDILLQPYTKLNEH